MVTDAVLKIIASTEMGFVTSLQGLSSFAWLAKKNQESNWTLESIPKHVWYFFPRDGKPDIPLCAAHFDIAKDLILFQVLDDHDMSSLPKATLSCAVHSRAEVIFLSWSPMLTLRDTL